MNLKEFVTEENIRAHCKGQENNDVWSEELSDEDIELLTDDSYLGKIAHEEVEFQAYMTFRYGNSLYKPDELAKRAKLPRSHVWAYVALKGRNDRGGIY